MAGRDKTRVVRWTAVVILVAGPVAAVRIAGAPPGSGPPWFSVVPPILAVLLALLTNRLIFSLTAAVVVGGMLDAVQDGAGRVGVVVGGFVRSGHLLVQCLTATDKQLILLYVALIMAMIAVMVVSGGLQGVAAWLSRFARSVRSTQLVTIGMGLLIFIDDYANTMIVGSTMRPATDRLRISREKLAFLVDATAAPVAGIALVSTWIGYEVGLLGDVGQSLGIARDGYAMFLDAMSLRCYCIGMIAFVFFNALCGEDFGPMARAERRARRHGKLLDDGASPMTSSSLAAALPHAQARIRARTALVPMVAVLALFAGLLWFAGGGRSRLAADPLAVLRYTAWRETFSAVDSIPLLAGAAAGGLLVASGLALLAARIPLVTLAKAVGLGLRGSLLPVTILVLAWSLKGACDELQTGRFLAGLLGDTVWPAVFPLAVFLIAGVTSFATGTSWGTMAILIPTAVPVAFALDGDAYGPATVLTVAAVLDGAIFGDHCSPISDTTIMSSVASSCDHLAHVRTQIPYSLLVAVLALVLGYLPAALGSPRWATVLAGPLACGLLFLALHVVRRGRNMRQRESKTK